MNRFIAFIVSLMFLSCGCENMAKAGMFDAEEFYLDNGLRVIVIPNHKAPIVRQMLWYKVGSVDEKLGEGGMAHLLEHLMFRGTKKVGKDEYNKIIQENGIDGNAFTSKDFTVYYQSMDISRLELAMFLEADRMHNLNLSQENFELERDIVFQERKQMVDNSPNAPFAENLRSLIWGMHPYARPVTGQPSEIMGLKLEHLRDFYRRYYVPNNAILVLSGDIEPNMAKKLAEKYYGNLKKTEVGERVDFPDVDKNGETRLVMELPQINSTRLTNSWIVPSYQTKNDEIYNLMVLSKYLGEGETSKLYKKLVKSKKLALAVNSSYDFGGRSYGTFSIGILPKDGISADEMQQALDKAIDEAIAEIDIKEIENTKHKMRAGLVYLRDNPNEAASIAGALAASGMSLQEMENYEDNIAAVEPDSVKKTAEKYLRINKRIGGVLLPLGGLNG
ncbi:MAG: insulinase family protein [Alphaproteobacteria bacterium]|nr:insulinase family protein [Alphaproteobacteria bacterium]